MVEGRVYVVVVANDSEFPKKLVFLFYGIPCK